MEEPRDDDDFQDIKDRANRILYDIEEKRVALTELFSKIDAPSNEQLRDYIKEMKKLDAMRMAHGSDKERMELFKMDAADFAQRNLEVVSAERPLGSIVEDGKQICHKILETMKGAMYQQKNHDLDVWERNKTAKKRRSVRGSRVHNQVISRKYSHLRPESAQPKQRKARKAGDSSGTPGQSVPQTAPF